MAPIKVGEKLPAIAVKENAPTNQVNIHNLPGKVVLLGVPAAFSPSCSSQVPAYIEQYEAFANKGIQGIYVVAINDAYVVGAWKKALASEGTAVHFIADDTGDFTKEIGLSFAAGPYLGGHRPLRYALVAEDGVVTSLVVEEAPPNVTVTKADAVLAAL